MILFLDVDGVVSPVSRDWPPKHWGLWKQCPNIGFHLFLSREMGDALMDLGITIKWLTTWEADGMCNQFVAPALGWEPLEILSRAGCEEDPWWKLDALFRHGVDGPFIWADDDLADDSLEQILSERLDELAPGVPRMLVSPDYREGLTPQMLEAMAQFVKDHQ